MHFTSASFLFHCPNLEALFVGLGKVCFFLDSLCLINDLCTITPTFPVFSLSSLKQHSFQLLSIHCCGESPSIFHTMASPSSETSSEASTDTSTTGSASNASPPQRTNSHTIEATDASPNGPVTKNDDEESDSDVSMSTDSDDDEDESAQPASHIQTITTQQPRLPVPANGQSLEVGLSRKRRFSNSTAVEENRTHNEVHEDRKRLRAHPQGQSHLLLPRPPKDRSFLPAEIWHHIFTFCPPRVLGQLLRVNKSFNSYIGISPNNFGTAQPKNSSLRLLNPDEIWRASRKRFLPGAPGPLSKFSELTMWKLACGNLCQFCNKQKQVEVNGQKDQWHPGPGTNGVSPIWNFGTRTCGSCLKENSLTVGHHPKT